MIRDRANFCIATSMLCSNFSRGLELTVLEDRSAVGPITIQPVLCLFLGYEQILSFSEGAKRHQLMTVPPIWYSYAGAVETHRESANSARVLHEASDTKRGAHSANFVIQPSLRFYLSRDDFHVVHVACARGSAILLVWNGDRIRRPKSLPTIATHPELRNPKVRKSAMMATISRSQCRSARHASLTSGGMPYALNLQR